MVAVITLESTTKEKRPYEVTAPSDPTGTLPAFALTTTDTQPTTWVNGEWVGAWSSTTGKASALTPLIGAGQALDVAPATNYMLWIRPTVGAEQPVLLADSIRVT